MKEVVEMPLPLIPVILIGIGSASGVGGVLLGGKGAQETKQARSTVQAAINRHEADRAITEAAVEETNARLAQYGQQQQKVLVDVVVRMGEFLRRNAKRVKESGRLLVDGVDVTVGVVPSSGELSIDPVAWVRGVIGSVSAGAGVSAGVTSAATSLGVASTGAAVSGLSGAAAESATLAFLGGGSLASGGGGMALGAAALNFVAIGPALLVGGFMVKSHGAKALTEALERETAINLAIEELADTRARLAVVDQRTDELNDLLAMLCARAAEALALLESEPFDPVTHVERFHAALNLVMAVRDVCATPIVDVAGELNDETAGFTVKYRPMTEETSSA